jgi:hypothetical protein
MKRFSFALFILTMNLILVAQSNRTRKVDFPKQIKLINQAISIPPKIYAQLSSIIIYNNLLISIEPNNDTIFSVFKLPSCKFISSFGINGRGPNEFARPDARNAVATKLGLNLKDLSDRFINIDLSDFIKTNVFNISFTKLPGELEALNNGFQLNDSVICGMPYMGGRNNKPYIRYNLKTKKVETFGTWPELYPKEREKIFWLIYSGRSRVKPDKSMFATFMFDVKMFRIYKNTGELYKEVIIETQDNFFNGQWIRSYPLNYYTCIRATDSYLYALNEACSGPEMPKNLPTLEIWDWNGNPVAKIQLDISVSQFDITKDGKMMYCIDWSTMDKIFTYNLESVIK